MKVFIDTDVIIDFLTGRPPFGENAKLIFQAGKEGRLSLYTSPVVLSNVSYIIEALESKKTAFAKIKKFCELVQICSMGQTTIDSVIKSKFPNFEDGLQSYGAIQSNIAVLVTRNIKDYKHSTISVMTPEELLSSLERVG